MPTTEGYNGAHTGAQIDAAISAVKQKESTWDSKASKPISRQITLASENWSNNMQTVTVSGILADESKQLIQYMSAIASYEAYKEAGISCIGQGNNTLTFKCETVPSASLSLYVVFQEVTV